MALNLQEKTDILEIRTDSLEDLLGKFISAANRTMVRLETDTLNFRGEMDDFKDEMKDFKDEMKDFKDEMKDFKDDIRADTKNLKDKLARTDSRLAVLSEEMKADTEALRKGLREDAARTDSRLAALTEEMRADTKKLRKELREEAGRFDNKMGTLVENMMAPGIPGIAKVYFGDSDFDSFAVRVQKKRAGRPGEKREFDMIAVSEKNFYVNETKSSPRPEYVSRFARVLPDIPDYFPECRGKKIIPIFSSLYIPDNVVMHLTRHGIYAMGLKEDSMELLNFDQVEERLRK